MKRVFLSFFVFLTISYFVVDLGVSDLRFKIQEMVFPNRWSDIQILVSHRQIFMGVFHLLEQDLLRRPQEKWADRMKTLQSRFSYSIFLTTYHELALTAQQKDQLRKGMIVAIGQERYRFYKQVGNTRMVIGKDPFAGMEAIVASWDYRLFLWGFSLAFTALITVAWITPYWRKLRRISSAALAFGNGDFNIRAEISNRSALRPMADAFNTMADRIQQLIRSHKELTNAVSHELRTPIARMRFSLEMLKTATAPEKRHHYGQELRTDINELKALSAELLTLARLDREKPDLHFVKDNIELWLSRLVADFLANGRSIDCRLRVSLPPGSCCARFEPRYLARSLDNLIQNALRYARGQLQIIVEKQKTDCCIHIDDDGPGVPENDWGNVFKPFTRLDGSRNRDSGGYGLGLAIVAQIAVWHNGTISVSRSPMGGARFTFRWPGFARQ